MSLPDSIHMLTFCIPIQDSDICYETCPHLSFAMWNEHDAEIDSDIRKDKELKGGWKAFFEKYTFPPLEYKPASRDGRNSRCKPSWGDPLKKNM